MHGCILLAVLQDSLNMTKVVQAFLNNIFSVASGTGNDA